MPAPNVDLVLVLDTSASMAPCFEKLRRHLADLAQPMQGHVSKVRYGLVTTSVAKSPKSFVYHMSGLGGVNITDALYADHPNDPPELFTENPSPLVETLSQLQPQGDEDLLIALDCALDFPFGPLDCTKRVIALFSDEPLEGNTRFDQHHGKIPDLVGKIQARRVQLFMAMPQSEPSEKLAEADKSELEPIDGGDGLAGVDFKLLLGQMGKSISSASLQASREPIYTRALFGQDKWGRGSGTFDGMR